MPTYEYNCQSCGLIEINQSINDKPLELCPKCKGTKIKRILSICSSHFKGEGWTPKHFPNKKR